MSEDEKHKEPEGCPPELPEVEETAPEHDAIESLPEAKSAEPTVEDLGREPAPNLVNPDLEAVMQAALASVERRSDPAAKDIPPPPTKKELELKLQILDLQHRIRKLEADLEKRTLEVRQNFEQGQRLKEQMESYRMRVQKEKADQFNYGHEPLTRELLPVVDNLERALDHATGPENLEALREGVALTHRLFLQVFAKFGVEQVKALGQKFDPAFHEAMRATETGEAEPNTVVEEHHKGYLLRDRLLRPSMVTISRRPAAAEPAKAEAVSKPIDSEPEGVSEPEPAIKGKE